VRGVGRRFDQVIEDITIDQGLRDVYGVEACVPYCLEYRITNPGTDFSGWYDLDGDGVLDPVSFTAEQLGIPEAERSYYALELSLERRFTDGWMVQGSYTWSHSYGNYEGIMSSDYGGGPVPYLSLNFDTPGLMEHASGDLANDRRHNLKIFGVYSSPWGLQVGGSFWYLSGRPVNGFGMHPADALLQDVYGPVAFYNNAVACSRGCGGTGDASWALDLMLRYEFESLGANWNVRVDAFNLLDNQAAVQVDEVAELITFEPNPSYRQPRYYQPPRSVRLGFGVSF